MAKIKTRARAVDMLGRQQIAGIQNAISEIFKNAHDAYANHARIDFFPNSGKNGEGFLIVRDDGIGMTQADFENKWLVLGTESKTQGSRNSIYHPPGFRVRPITGEKGIGRLAIALLGNQVIILSRAVRQDGMHDLVISWIHWGLFEIPGLNLEDVEIPVLIVQKGQAPSSVHVSELRSKLLDSVTKLNLEYPEITVQQIIQEIKDFNPDPSTLNQFFESREDNFLNLEGERTGTHFLIGPSNPIIDLEIQAEDLSPDYSFRKHLLGFYDTVFGDESESPLITSFKRWQPGSLVGDEYLDPSFFFTKDDLLNKSDHYLVGEVDAYGQFKGSLQVYDKEYNDIVVPWPNPSGKLTQCGPFKILFGYNMGRATSSQQSPEDWKSLYDKCEKIGGIYVYMDGIRVLPYGDHSTDWLEVEKRRNLGAGYYYFSFRRMFGAVLLTRSLNGTLEEKAGREGFQQNYAYKQMREILMHFLVQLAAEFFRSGGTYTENYEKSQAEVKRRSLALERQQKRAIERRNKLADELKAFQHAVDVGLPESEISNIRQMMQKRMTAASELIDQDKAASALIRSEREALEKLNALRERYKRRKPAGIALTKFLSEDWDNYIVERERLESTLFTPFENEIADTLGVITKQAKIYINQRKRLEDRIKSLAEERKKQLAEASKMANYSASDTRETVFKITEKARLALEETIKGIEADLNRTDINSLSPDKIEELRKDWERQVDEIETRHRNALLAARDMLGALAENLRASDGEQPAEIMEAIEQRMIALEEQAEEDFEMVQLGIAISIINHEFSAAIRRVRKSVQDLGQISRKHQGLRPLYTSIKTNFEHLDGHLNLFTPLQRRLYRTPQTINGKSMRNYINDVFSSRMERHNIKLECSERFLECNVTCYPSTLYPAIINIVDNALFWLSNENSDRIIRLDASNESLIISNTGPAIEERDMKRIFERGFSRKINGRGLGLFISVKALASEGMHLHAIIPPNGFGAAFEISIPELGFEG